MYDKLTLSSWYILPLVGIDINKLDSQQFINSYVSTQNLQIHLECTTLIKSLTNKQLYNTYYKVKDRTFMIFNIPHQYWLSFTKFIEGNYSKMDESAKVKIKKLSPICSSSVKHPGHFVIKKDFKAYEHLVQGLYNKTLPTGSINPLWQKISDQVGEEIPANSELLPKPDLEKEVIENYLKNLK